MIMLSRVRSRLTYANLMSTIAVFGVLAGGGAYAAATIGARDIKRNAVRAKHIKKNAVRAKHIKKNAISTAKLAIGAVTSGKLADEGVVTAKLADGAVTSGKLADAGVVTAKLADGEVTSGKLADGGVVTAKLADGAVTSGKLADGGVSTGKLADGAVTGAKLAADLQTAVLHVEADGSLIAGTPGATVEPGTVAVSYCFELPFVPVGGSVTAGGGSHSTILTLYVPTSLPECPAPGFTDAEVLIFDNGNPPVIKQTAFFVVFH
jgi:hypothetical protein